MHLHPHRWLLAADPTGVTVAWQRKRAMDGAVTAGDRGQPASPGAETAPGGRLLRIRPPPDHTVPWTSAARRITPLHQRLPSATWTAPAGPTHTAHSPYDDIDLHLFLRSRIQETRKAQPTAPLTMAVFEASCPLLPQRKPKDILNNQESTEGHSTWARGGQFSRAPKSASRRMASSSMYARLDSSSRN
jgi:hypothetical protein